MVSEGRENRSWEKKEGKTDAGSGGVPGRHTLEKKVITPYCQRRTTTEFDHEAILIYRLSVLQQ